MDEVKFADLLMKHFHLAKKPSSFELHLIKIKATRVRDSGLPLDDEKLWDILKETLSDSSVMVLDSVDMTTSINLLGQIIAMLKNRVQ